MCTETAEGLRPPLERPLERQLRRAVLDHTTEVRKRYRPLLHLGEPGGVELTFAITGEPIDQALRADIISAMRHRALASSHGDLNRPLVWLTRPGDLDTQDIDAAWLAAARQSFAEANEPLTFVVVNRRGWRDPRSGVERTWRRLRARTGSPKALDRPPP